MRFIVRNPPVFPPLGDEGPGSRRASVSPSRACTEMGKGVKPVRVKRLGGVKRGDFLPGFIRNICFHHYSSYLGYFLRVCSYGNWPSMKDPFTGAGDKEQPYGVNFEGAPSPPPVSGSPSTTVLAPRGASTTSQGPAGVGDGRRWHSEMVGWLWGAQRRWRWAAAAV